MPLLPGEPLGNTVSLDNSGYPKVDITTYKCENGLELVLCTVDSPLYAVYVNIPTFIQENKGLPHTLEHLIFCGSHDYPERGYLDRLATLCQSHGTNAYTSDDHTCYTFTTCTLSGLIRLLPVFLDHIFRPTIDNSTVEREVFHRDSTGGRGVVYCEMAAREWSEQDQMDLALRRGIISKLRDEELTVYGWECGGMTKALTRLNVKEIRSYHQKYYRSDNAVIVLVGGVELREQISSLVEILNQVQFTTTSDSASKNLDLPLPSINVLESFEPFQNCELTFPANDETLGSVGFSWAGPPSNDLYTIVALHILLRMLKDTSASPLYQHFVERSDPIASDIDYEIKSSHQTILTIIFSGVPILPSTEENFKDKEGVVVEEDNHSESSELEEEQSSPFYLQKGVLLSEFLDCIKTFRSDLDMIKERLKVAIKSTTIKLQESLEEEPHDICAAYCVPEIVRAHWPFKKSIIQSQLEPYGLSLSLIPKYLTSLSNEPLPFWLNLLDQYFLSEEPVEVRTIPSRRMNDTIKEWESEQLEGIPIISLPSNDNHTNNEKVIEPFHLGLPNPVNCLITNRMRDDKIQIVQVPNTSVKRLTLAFDMSQSVPPELWPTLVLFQELIFQSDVKLEDEQYIKYKPPILLTNTLMPYQKLIEELSGVFSTFEASVGFDNGIFSTNYLDSHLILALHGRENFNQQEMTSLALAILAGTVFTRERVAEVVENLVSQLKDTWSEASSVLDARLTQRLSINQEQIYHPKRSKPDGIPCKKCPMIETAISIVAQTEFLCRARTLLETEPEALLGMLEQVQSKILNSPMMVNFGSSQSDSTITTTSNVPPQILSSAASPPPLSYGLYSLPKYGYLEGCSINDKGYLEIIPVSDITASYLSISCPVNILPFSGEGDSYPSESIDEFLCTALLCQLMSFTEGPLYRRIRGAGLAYGVSLSIAVWSGLLCFNLDDSTHPVSALKIFEEMIEIILKEAKGLVSPTILTDENIRAAQAVQLFQFVSERATPSAIISTAFRTVLRGLPPIGSERETAWNVRLMELEWKDLAKCACKILPPMLEPLKSIRILAVPTSRLDTICSELSQINLSHTINNFPDQSLCL